MIFLIILLAVLCPSILLIWMCCCIVKTSRNTQVIAETLTGQKKKTEPVSVQSESKAWTIIKTVVIFLIMGIIIAASIALL